ncbi:Glycoside hydrolase superfamily [Penicillium taxi]|uniref:Glycoside hydrolase superfamily n=1 Tax=Penicillium taxi TaxID=168475 RepID=UPI002545A203|nr:Glycoside hydrolase superfamily [Penicillium taxi]KAJ5898864.1 Glycoside hydrolase superfamily [Penicillium taxi]
MRNLTQALLALSVACAHAASQDPGSGNLQRPQVVVWVDEDGNPFRTETLSVFTTTIRQMPTTFPSQSTPTKIASQTLFTQTRPQPTESDTHLAGTRPEKHPLPNYNPPHHEPTRPNSDNRPYGISYSPYNADRSCKTQEEVNQDVAKLAEYSFIRIYGTDCDQAKTLATAARLHTMQVFGGIYDLTDFPNSLKAFDEAATLPNGKKDWAVFHTIAIGNELVNSNMYSPAEVTAALSEARGYLRSYGYNGPVVTVDTFSVLLKHPDLCHASDYCAANCHAFFDNTQQPHNAGPYALEQAHAVSAAAGGKRTVITESGWPHAGLTNGAAVPSRDNQQVAVESLKSSFAHRGDDLVLFTAFDDLWKPDNQFTFDAERFWGINER